MKKMYRYFGGMIKRQENWLNHCAAKGYRLKKVHTFSYEFEACQPNEVQYCVDFIARKAKEDASSYHQFLTDVDYNVFYKNLNLNYSVGKVRIRPWAKQGGRLATKQTTYNKELLIVEKKNDGKPFELHTTYLDKAQYYQDLSVMWLFMFLFLLMFAFVYASFITMLLSLVFLVPCIAYAKQVFSLKREGKMKEW